MGAQRETVLIEHPDGATRWALERSLRRQGNEVLNCPGPSDRRHRDCPILAGNSCTLVDAADRVLNGVPGRAGDQLMAYMHASPDVEVRRLDPAPMHRGRPVSEERLHLLASLDAALRRRDRAGRADQASGRR